MEDETVASIVNLHWVKRRVMRTAQLGFRRDPFAIETGRFNPKDLDDLVRLMTSASADKTELSQAAKQSIEACKGALETVMKIETACLPGHSKDGPPREAFDAARKARDGVEVVQVFGEQVFPRMIAVEDAAKSSDGATSVYEKAYSHEHLEKIAAD